MWLGLALATRLLAPPEPSSEPELARARPPIGRLSTWFGPGVATGLTARRYGDPRDPTPNEGQLAAATGLGVLHGQVAGYADHEARRSRAITMLTPELRLDLEFGGTHAWRDPIAEQRELAGRHGVAVGVSGATVIGFGWASPGVAGVYARVTVGQHFSARTNTNLEGPYAIAALGPSVGLRVNVHRMFTLLVGGGVDGLAGVQRFDDRGRLIAQLAPIVEFATYSQPTPDVYFGFVARGDMTVLGQRYGGQRLHGRASAELGWRLTSERVAKPKLNYAALLLTYEGTRIDAAPGHPQFAALGERRISHQLLLAGGISF